MKMNECISKENQSTGENDLAKNEKVLYQTGLVKTQRM